MRVLCCWLCKRQDRCVGLSSSPSSPRLSPWCIMPFLQRPCNKKLPPVIAQETSEQLPPMQVQVLTRLPPQGLPLQQLQPQMGQMTQLGHMFPFFGREHSDAFRTSAKQ